MAEREGEARDHPHHRSLWSAYGDVNGVDDWSEEEGHGTIAHQAFVRQEQGPVFGGFTAGGLWQAPDGEPLLREERSIRAYNVGGDRRLLDYTLTLVADQGRDIVFGDTKEGGLLSVRVATSMDGARGGTIENAGGGRGEAACWGKPSPWCDYSGRVEDQIVGIALLDHPSNPGHPARWHVRDYGLMTANPFATGRSPAVRPRPSPFHATSASPSATACCCTAAARRRGRSPTRTTPSPTRPRPRSTATRSRPQRLCARRTSTRTTTGPS
jgi:hypothetical protein